MLLRASLLSLILTLSAFAHHSFIAEYDSSKPLTLTGTISGIQWMNPHIWIYIDVKDAKGIVTKWQCEGGSPNSLRHHGWTKDTIKPGDRVSLEGFSAKDMVNTCIARYARLPDGRKLSSSASDSNNER